MSIGGTRSTRVDIALLYIARGVRGLGDGFAIIILPAYLSAIGFNAGEIGIIFLFVQIHINLCKQDSTFHEF